MMKNTIPFLCTLSLGACARPITFARVDGRAINPAELSQAKAVCRGAAATSIRPTSGPVYAPSFHVENSNIYGGGGSQGYPVPAVHFGHTFAGLEEARDRRDAELGCMAQFGYVDAGKD